MTKNMSNFDRIIRLTLALVLFTLFFTGTVTGVSANVLIVFGVVFAITGIVGNCPLYALFGISTCRVPDPKQ
jgi:hypothetical protein